METTTENDLTSEPAELLGRKWTASELRRLSAEARDVVLSAAAALAESDYRHNPELTDFEAFGADDLYGDISQSATR